MNIKPVGNKLIVLELPEEDYVSDGGIGIVNLTLSKAVVIEVSDYLKDVYKQGDKIIFPKGSGNEMPYKGKPHKFINGQQFPQGDVWAIVTEDISKKDKEDSL